MENREKAEAVQRMQDHILRHLQEPVTLGQLAACAGYSPYYCVRIFRELTGRTPFEYLRSLRLSRAAIELRDEKARIIDVALDFVFDSQEGFTRAFSREFGVTPARYRKAPSPIRLFMPASAPSRTLDLVKGDKEMEKKPAVQTVFVQVIQRPERNLILKRGVKAEDYYAYCEEVGCDIWGLLCGVREALYEPVGLWLPNSLVTPGTSRYVQGVEVPADYRGVVPEGLEVISLPPCQMMVFQGPPYGDERFEEAISELWDVMKDYDPELYGFRWADEDAPRFQMEPQGWRGYIEARPVRPVNG